MMRAATSIENGLPPPDESEMIQSAASGDPRSFARLYLRYVKRVSSLVGKMLHHTSECEDVIQDVFLQVHLSLPRFEGRSSFYSWIYRLAANVALHHIRKSVRPGRSGSMGLELTARLPRPSWLMGSNPEVDAELNELLAEITRVVDQLAPKLRDAMILGPIQGRNNQELAGILGITPDIVKARLCRARQTVRTSLRLRNSPGFSPLPVPANVRLTQSSFPRVSVRDCRATLARATGGKLDSRATQS
jgi:RNA polymerase sigma-70 factor (ECF subfamily)